MTTDIAERPKWNVLTERPPGTPEWEAAHEERYGSTDLATIMGLTKFGRTKLKLWAEKTKKIERENISSRPEVRRGLLLEPVVIGMFEGETGKKVLRSPGTVQHPTIPYLIDTADGLTNGGLSAFEGKSVGLRARKDWLADIPLHVQIQGHVHMWVLGLSLVNYAGFCLDAEPDEEEEDGEYVPTEDSLLLWAQRERRDDLIETMGNELVQFHEKHVLADIPPEPGDDIKTVKAIWKRHAPGKVVQLAAELEIAIANNAEWAKQRTALKKQQDAAKAEISMAMGDAEYGVTTGGVVVRLREEPRKEHWVAASSPRVLRVVKKVGS